MQSPLSNEDKILILKNAIDKMLKGIDFALDENFSRKAISSRLKECRSEAIKILKNEDKNAKH